MFTPIDWMVHLEQARSSLSKSGQQRLTQLAALEYLRGRLGKKPAVKPPEPSATTLPCCEPQTA